MRNAIITGKILCLALFFALAGCSTGYKAYQGGDYYRACEEAVQRLQSNPTQKKARAALAQAYPLAVQDAARQTDMNTLAQNVQRLESNIGIYDRMNNLAESILHSPGALTIIPNPTTYYTELQQTKQLVAGLYYQQGMEALNQGTLESARIAVQFLSKTQFYSPNYPGINQQLQSAIYLATIRVIVTRPALNLRYALDADFFYNKLMSYINASTYKYLVRFYTPEEATAEKMSKPNQILSLDFTDFTIGNSHSSTDSKEYRRDSIVVGTTKVNGVNQNVYGTVKANYVLNRLEVISSGALQVTIVDASNSRILNQQRLGNQYVWYCEWASFNGDERALTRDQVALTGRRMIPVPPPQNLFASFADPLYAKTADYISTVYARVYSKQ